MNAETTKTPKTLEEKLDAARALVAKYEQEIKTLAIVNDVREGDDVDVTFGRGDKKRVVSGTITGFKEDSVGKWAAVESGEGFDKHLYKVLIQHIVENRSAAKRNKTSDDANPLNAA